MPTPNLANIHTANLILGNFLTGVEGGLGHLVLTHVVIGCQNRGCGSASRVFLTPLTCPAQAVSTKVLLAYNKKELKEDKTLVLMQQANKQKPSNCLTNAANVRISY